MVLDSLLHVRFMSVDLHNRTILLVLVVIHGG
jgi:hypothetical protein